MAKRISAVAIGALDHALVSIYWYKPDLRKFLSNSIDDQSILHGIDWDGNSKRDSVTIVLARLQGRSDDMLALMREVSRMEDFSHLRRLPEDGPAKADVAIEAVAALREMMAPYEEKLREQEENEKRIEKQQAVAQETKDFSESLESLKAEFMALYSEQNPQKRGYLFEKFLTRLFALFDLNPRGAFKIEGEQIDGAFTLDGRHFLLEAKWQKDPSERAELDALKAKVEAKIKGTLGLFVSINGFKKTAVDLHSKKGALMILMDGQDLMAVLEGRIGLVDLLQKKHRHAAETGDIDLAVEKILT